MISIGTYGSTDGCKYLWLGVVDYMMDVSFTLSEICVHIFCILAQSRGSDISAHYFPFWCCVTGQGLHGTDILPDRFCCGWVMHGQALQVGLTSPYVGKKASGTS